MRALPRILRRMSLRNAVIFLVLSCVALTTVYPLVYMATTALKTEREFIDNPRGLPSEPSLWNFQAAWVHGQFARYAGNSAIVVVAGVTVSWVVCSMAGYALSHLRFRGRRLAFFAILGSMMIAPQVILIPLYGMLNGLGLLNQHTGLILVYGDDHIAGKIDSLRHPLDQLLGNNRFGFNGCRLMFHSVCTQPGHPAYSTHNQRGVFKTPRGNHAHLATGARNQGIGGNRRSVLVQGVFQQFFHGQAHVLCHHADGIHDTDGKILGRGGGFIDKYLPIFS